VVITDIGGDRHATQEMMGCGALGAKGRCQTTTKPPPGAQALRISGRRAAGRATKGDWCS
jgi:hypothetical protein